MKVAYFSNHFVESNGHGIARYVRQLYEAIHDLQSDICLMPVSSLSEKKIQNITRLKEKSNLKLLPWGRYVTALSWGFLKRPYLEHWLGNGFDLLHAPNLGYPVPTKKPYVVTVHDIGPLTRPEFFSKRSIRWMNLGFAHMVKRAAGIICVSQATADEVLSLAGKHIGNRLHVIHEGVDPLFFKEPDWKCLEGLPDLPPQGTPFCLAAGAISPRKNVLRIVQAMEKLKDELPHHLCFVGGSGWDAREVFDHFRDSPITDRIHHLGYVSDAQLHALYSSADVFVYPSLFEGFGLPVLEAMASGCPVVTSNTSSLPEVAGDSAVLVDPYDIPSITEAIYQLCSNSAYAKRFSGLGKQRASQFTWNECAFKVAEVYKIIT